MKMVSIGFVFASAMIAASGASAGTPATEIGYERGALGFEALMANDNETALRQIQSTKSVPHNDPARLINLGRAHARLGNVSQAQQAFEAAANCKEHFDIVLSSGKVMNSRKAAMLSLQSLKK
jgi:Flp pilus assembly protein TadD